MDKELETSLVRFKRARDAMVHADADELEHHLKEFVREIRRNPLVQGAMPPTGRFDTEAWWKSQVGDERYQRRLTSLALPDNDDDCFAALLDLTESMASDARDQLSISGFGQYFGKHKRQDSTSLAVNLVFRPFAELLSDRIREHVMVANPAIRELAAVPLDRIPPEGETRVFLSHKTVDKPLVEPYYKLLTELGLTPWLDAHDMRIGDVPHRGIAKGFDQACAVVFFLTKNFRDERWLAHEIDQAVNRKVERGDRFAIITLLFEGAEVPQPLKTYLYYTVANEVLAAQELIRSLPVELGPPRWRK